MNQNQSTPLFAIGKVVPREITAEMRESYLDYAMSVIVSRALPDVRDGLKPVHRRILYSMHELGLTHGAKTRKSATIIGDVLGKYHPHGDIAVYDALVRMAQEFSLRYPLVDGQGNFGSVDGDSAAHYRYTEARMTRIAEELLHDIHKDTVAFRDNYDATRKEPVVLPAAVPNLLLNGTLGIAVGMATNIPPHHLGELIDALIHLIAHPDASLDDLLEMVKGPDFPTGGIIFDRRAIRDAYASGRGAILMRGKVNIEEGARGMQIVITEIPYQVNKAELISTMALLAQEKRIEGIRDIRDESDKDGLRIAIDLKQDAQPQKVLNNLYRKTDLEKSFHLNMLALVGGIQPVVLSIKGVLEEFLKHRVEVVTRRTQFDLARTRERIHILEGLKKALDHIDAIIATIRRSSDRAEAHQNLIKKFTFSDLQASAILDMRLAALAGLERQKIEDELKEKLELARSLGALLKDPRKLRDAITRELIQIKERYGDERKTQVIKSSPKELSDEDLIPQEEIIIVHTRGGYIKRMKPGNYRMQKRGGKGLIGIATKEEDMVEHLLTSSTHAHLLFFTSSGKVYRVPAYEIPEGTRTAKGRLIVNFLALAPKEEVTSILTGVVEESKDKDRGYRPQDRYIVMLTKYGIIKKVERDAFAHVRSNGLIAMTLKAPDALMFARFASGTDDLLLLTAHGQAVRFSEREVRAMGRQAAGVKALRLRKDDHVIGMEMVPAKTIGVNTPKLLVVMTHGYGKQTLLSYYKKQRRGGSGIKTAKITAKTGALIGGHVIGSDETELIAISRKGQVIKTNLGAIPALSRATQGVRIMKLDPEDAIASITTL
ncbi:MAG: DNA gyrase subunit A [Parcubacteria group bacterium Gr01-1014_66]|nr:MAG: DNA gyrase subunit A [Parcubacteria group bacterium Gr01-1014_66]